MKETKKRKRWFRIISLWIPVWLLILFVYMNVKEFMGHNDSKNHDNGEDEIPKVLPEGNTISPNAWSEPAVSKNIAQKVYYVDYSGLPSDISKRSPVESFKPIKEDLVDLAYVNNPRIRPAAELDSQYTSLKEYGSKVRKGLYKCLLNMLTILPESIGIAYFEGHRTPEMHREIFDSAFAKLQNNNLDPEIAYDQAASAVDDLTQMPSVLTGGAISMTLFNNTKNSKTLLDMGSDFTLIPFHKNVFDEKKYLTFSDQITLEQKKNRLLLLDAATSSGLVNYGMEWWFYSIGEKIWSKITDKPMYYDVINLIKLSKSEYLAEQAAKLAAGTTARLDTKAIMTKNNNQSESALDNSAETMLNVPNSKEQVMTTFESSPIISIQSAEEFDKLIMSSNQLILVEFSATWCKWCRSIEADLVKFALNSNVRCCLIDVDRNPDLATRYQVRYKPTFAVFYKGQLLEIFGESSNMRIMGQVLEQICLTHQLPASLIYAPTDNHDNVLERNQKNEVENKQNKSELAKQNLMDRAQPDSARADQNFSNLEGAQELNPRTNSQTTQEEEEDDKNAEEN